MESGIGAGTIVIEDGRLEYPYWPGARQREETSMRLVLCVLSLSLLPACAVHRLTVAHPNPTGAPIMANSNAFGWGAVQRRTVADCDTDLIDEVRVHQNLGQAIASVLTFGAWMPTRIEYRCAKVPSTTGDTDR
jgi:hypothetical protein